MKEKVIGFIKKDTVLCVAMTLAMVSAFFVKPTLNYVNYIDFRVLGILLSLMTVMAGLQRNGLFDMIGSSLLKRTKNTMQLSLVLVFLCFFFSMFITNDVSLITFVPFAMLTLRKCNQDKLLIPVIIVQTLAANLGSMLTPIGNPQNLYLYNLAEMKMSTFIGIIGPYTLTSGILLLLSVAVVPAKVADTTGAGDTLNGAFCTMLAENADLESALRFANTAASLSTEKFGAQTGMPTREEVEAELKK